MRGLVWWPGTESNRQMATADGGVIGKSGIIYDQNGSATGQAHAYTQSWVGDAYQIGSVEQVVVDVLNTALAHGWWPFAGGNASGNGTAIEQPWFALLPSCPGAATPCAQEAAWSALRALRTFINSCPDTVCKTLVYDKLGGTISKTVFFNFLSRQNIGLYDGPKSYAPQKIAFCARDNGSACFYPSMTSTVHDFFQTEHPDADAAAQTPSSQGQGPQIFFRPATGICNVFSVSNPQSGDRGVLNQATLFHEALHGWTGKVDYTPFARSLESDLTPTNQGLTVPSAVITYYLKDQVLFPIDAGNFRSCGN